MAKSIPEFRGTVACGLSSAFVPQNGKESSKNSLEINGSQNSKKSRHEEAERKRLESIKRQRQSYSQKQNLISSALKSIDSASSAAPVNKKIKFNSSSSSDEDSDETPHTTKAISDKVAGKPSSKAVSNGRAQLFDDDDDDPDDGINFEFDSQKFNGAAGSKLLELQSRYGGADQRFKLDARFLDDDDVANTGADKGNVQDADTRVLRAERHANIRILEKVLGKPLEKDVDDRPKTKAVPYLRYDPENPAHRQFQMQNDDDNVISAAKGDAASDPSSSSQEESESEDSANAVEATPAPIGLDTEFAERLRQTQAGVQKESNGEKTDSGFSLRKLFGRDEVPTISAGSSNDKVTVPITLPSWQRSFMRVADSSSEDEQETKPKVEPDGAAKAKDTAVRLKKKLAAHQSFFFYDEKDQRITAEGEKFRRLEDIESVRSRWEKQRVGLIQFYKNRRKEALKKQRLRKEKESAGKGKKGDKTVDASQQLEKR